MDTKEPLARGQSLDPYVLLEGGSEEWGCLLEPITPAAPRIPSGQSPWSAQPTTGASIEPQLAEDAHERLSFLNNPYVQVRCLLES